MLKIYQKRVSDSDYFLNLNPNRKSYCEPESKKYSRPAPKSGFESDSKIPTHILKSFGFGVGSDNNPTRFGLINPGARSSRVKSKRNLLRLLFFAKLRNPFSSLLLLLPRAAASANAGAGAGAGEGDPSDSSARARSKP